MSVGNSDWFDETYKPHATSSSKTEQLLPFGLLRIIREDFKNDVVFEVASINEQDINGWK